MGALAKYFHFQPAALDEMDEEEMRFWVEIMREQVKAVNKKTPGG
jgi:uncharacterized Fe-S cluster-containing radical SAM superfamily protein